MPDLCLLLHRLQVPPNGLVLYTGTIVTEDGKEKKVTIDFEPFKPINASLYLCDNKFHTEALNELLESDDKFGFIVMDGNGALFGTLSGNTREILHKFSVDLPKKHGRGDHNTPTAPSSCGSIRVHICVADTGRRAGAGACPGTGTDRRTQPQEQTGASMRRQAGTRTGMLRAVARVTWFHGSGMRALLFVHAQVVSSCCVLRIGTGILRAVALVIWFLCACAGGQSALRFARLRMEKRHNYVRKTAELAVQFFINPQTSQINVSGLILAGSADFKTELGQSDMFDQRLQVAHRCLLPSSSLIT